MNSKNRFSIFLKWTFGILKWIVVALGVLLSFLLLFLGDIIEADDDPEVSVVLGEYLFEFSGETQQVIQRENEENGIKLEKLKAEFHATDPQLFEEFFPSAKPFLMVILLTAFGLVFYLFHLLSRLFAYISDGKPFSRESIQCIRYIGLLVIVGSLAGTFMVAVADWVQYNWIAENFDHESIEIIGKPDQLKNFGLGFRFNGVIRLQFELPALFFGFMIFAIGEAFRQGQKIQEENELTV